MKEVPMTVNNFYTTLGKKIHDRRKSMRMTQRELADRIGKSVATVSKYEKGKIEISIDVLIDICVILNLSIYNLLPATVGSKASNANLYKTRLPDKLYLYFFNTEKNRIKCSVIENNNAVMRSTLFFGVGNVRDYFNSDFIYNGKIIYSDTGLTFIYQNADPPFDLITLRLPSLSKKSQPRTGIMTCISYLYQYVALKIVAGEAPITDDEYLRSRLRFSSEEIKYIKRYNIFTIF